MAMLNTRWTVKVAVFIGCIGITSSPALAISLEESLRASLAKSSALAAARQSWLATREAIGTNTSTTDLKARLNATGSVGEIDSKAGQGFTKSQYVSTGVTLSKNLYDGGQTKEKTRLAEINLQQASAIYAKTEQVVILGTIEAYLDVMKAEREVKLHVRNLTRLEAHVTAAKIRVDAGAATPTRLAEARARYARAQSNSILAETRLNNAEDSFRSLTGKDASDFIEPSIAGNLPIDLLDAETKAQGGHPDILAAIAAERAADQAFNTLQAAVRPTLAFSLSANTRAGNGTTLDRDEIAAQLVLSSPLLSTNATTSKSRQIAANFKQAKLERAEATRKTEVAAREAFRNWQSTGIRVDAVMSEIDAFRLVAKGVASEAQFGQKTTLDLLDAEKDVNDAELSLVLAEHNQLLAAFRLNAAIGSLTAEQMGLGDVLGQLFDMPPTLSPFYNSFPFGRKSITN
jgi:outer membrane protein